MPATTIQADQTYGGETRRETKTRQAKAGSGKPRQRASILRRAIHGRMLSLDFFSRHWLWVLTIVVMLMIYITSRYTCQTQMEDIQRLTCELEVAKTERVREKSAYMSRIRESQMQKMVDSLRLGLTVQEQPPYRISLRD
ncbi:MAG: hypothetical protein K2G30_06815 [Muribaculaceae bacterium]|nr:hypothetical protein [Muribaculaceae bacterium]MDE7141572.1 hypothetical protein [Muribaculaceae bacterium]